MTIFELSILEIKIAPTYYGLMYAISFIIGYYILKKRAILSVKNLDSLLSYIFIGVILGGRLGYVLFYNLDYFIDNPSKIIAAWEGGMSFHGGAIGVIIAMIIFAYFNKISFLKLADNITSVIPIGLGLGRIGNYINKELLGFYPYLGPFGVEKDGKTHFPSPLLEAFLEGIVLFIILNFIYRKTKEPGVVSAFFLIGYGIFRIFIEFFRIPDEQIGYLIGHLTMGQLLSIPMILVGIGFIIYKKNVGYKIFQ